MDPMEAESLLRNLDRRTQQVEQILRTLPTREEVRAEIRNAVRPSAGDESLRETTAKLATREDLAAAIAPLATQGQLADAIAPLATQAQLAAAIEPLATKKELTAAVELLATKAELAAAVEPLATKKELTAAVEPLATRNEMREEGERTRRHFDVVAESLRDDIRLIAESQVSLQKGGKQDKREIDGILKTHEKRIGGLEAANARMRKRR
jgi:hypothetical protein